MEIERLKTLVSMSKQEKIVPMDKDIYICLSLFAKSNVLFVPGVTRKGFSFSDRLAKNKKKIRKEFLDTVKILETQGVFIEPSVRIEGLEEINPKDIADHLNKKLLGLDSSSIGQNILVKPVSIGLCQSIKDEEKVLLDKEGDSLKEKAVEVEL